MLVERAIFTSIRGGLKEGYQLAVQSPGISSEGARQLIPWGPAHDSLCAEHAGATSVNFHALPDGNFCLSKTLHAGAEYSGRGGPRVLTHMFVLDRETLRRFSNHPFRVLEALSAGRHLTVPDPLPQKLEPVRLVGRAAAVHVASIQRLLDQIDAQRLALSLAAVQERAPLAIVSPIPADRLFSGLLDLLPVDHRLELSFTTGLRPSPRRPFQVIAMPNTEDAKRQALRLTGVTLLDLNHPPPRESLPEGWPRIVFELLQGPTLHQLKLLVEKPLQSAQFPARWAGAADDSPAAHTG